MFQQKCSERQTENETYAATFILKITQKIGLRRLKTSFISAFILSKEKKVKIQMRKTERCFLYLSSSVNNLYFYIFQDLQQMFQISVPDTTGNIIRLSLPSMKINKKLFVCFYLVGIHSDSRRCKSDPPLSSHIGNIKYAPPTQHCKNSPRSAEVPLATFLQF